MYLSEKEECLIRKLRNYERRWFYFRWAYLAIGAAIFTGEYSDYSFHSEYVMALIALPICHAVINWRGNPYHALLLKILSNPETENEAIAGD